jgi:DNA-directed RNA polymerase subunit RPC12/RpoP
MRTLIQPPPSSRCRRCGGELLLKQIRSANRMLDLENEIFVCADCGRELSFTMVHDHYMPHSKDGQLGDHVSARAHHLVKKGSPSVR